MLQQPNRRRFLFLFIALVIGVVAFLAGRYSNTNNLETFTSTADSTACGSCMSYNNVKPSKSQLELNLLKTMVYNYQNLVPTSQTRSVWFSIETIKDFIHQIETKTCNTCTGALGIRFYFAKYPSVTGTNASYPDLTAVDASYAGIQTLFMVPTIDVGNYHFDFDPEVNCDPYKLPAMDSSGVYPSGGTTVTALMSQNHGDACPPPPPGKTCPAIGAYFNK